MKTRTSQFKFDNEKDADTFYRNHLQVNGKPIAGVVRVLVTYRRETGPDGTKVYTVSVTYRK